MNQVGIPAPASRRRDDPSIRRSPSTDEAPPGPPRMNSTEAWAAGTRSDHHPCLPDGRCREDSSVTSHPRFFSVGGGSADLIDLSQWRLNDLPDENSDEDWDDDRELIDPHGNRVETWREGYPYPERMQRREYELEKRRLQIELLKLQGWVKETGQKVLLLFEGRDAAGKGGTIKRFTEHLNPRGARVVALDKPSDRERA